MRNILVLFGIVLLLIGCEETNEEKAQTCQSLTTVADWTTIDFKENYTIQVPEDFIRNGLTHGFEGNTFFKTSPDERIILESYYGTWTRKFDFGPVLPDSIPASEQVRNRKGELINLDHRETFCNDSEIVGYLYYSQEEVCYGQLYWKAENQFQAALLVEFQLSELETVKKIIRTIKIKQSGTL